ncbi:hypothetical protein K432DRAFT_385915 [Lepidopterella palustris CBS 459.81]|uniref:Uncharacterized protein n=1 Tax=Lepidopterella palustris CBS 459.81 TaxID=1314670 RepID=A0A8E2E269_9PEZI|nr:hypothetical protein K432DRAFT_385915 [Lepidopterella palustris CBS 459.81]
MAPSMFTPTTRSALKIRHHLHHHHLPESPKITIKFYLTPSPRLPPHITSSNHQPNPYNFPLHPNST